MDGAELTAQIESIIDSVESVAQIESIQNNAELTAAILCTALLTIFGILK
jgi:hypothetical protein